MAQQHLDPPSDPTVDRTAGPSPKLSTAPPLSTSLERGDPHEQAGAPTGDALAEYLRAQATEFLRALRQHREAGEGGLPARGKSRAGEGGGTEDSGDAALALRRSARRISGTLHTFRALLDAEWSEAMRPELAWLSGTLAREHAYAARLDRLLLALHRLSGSSAFPTQTTGAAEGAGPRDRVGVPERGNLTVGAAKAGALLERQLTLARTRAHSAALQALGSSRFHAVADSVAVLASEVPLTPAAATADLRPSAAAAEERLTDAVAALPLVTAGHPYNAEALVHGLSPDPAPHPQDGPWHQVRLLLRLHRYALEVLQGRYGENAAVDLRLLAAGQALDRHRDASEAAAAAAAAARTPRIAPATAYALGVLHADQRHEVEAARFAFQQSWQKQAVGTP
ncbi:CHAD domain-containing protein [Streptomyces sp. NPDC001796]|uniref:CHAD domain-containing protein n=1 Tax=Streptomyces sp. NPDC001796 TaxID=3364609 RepID=UPI0036932D6A